MAVKFSDHILAQGVHADLPAAATTPVAALFSCTDHSKVYRNNGASWDDWFAGGGVGGGWDLVIDEDGSSFANWTSIAGTWSSSGGNIQNTDNAAAFRDAYLTTPKVALANCVIEFEIQFPTTGQGTAPNYGGIYPGTPGSSVTDQTTIRLQRDAVAANSIISLNPSATAPTRTVTVTLALDTWYLVRAVRAGSAVSIYLDGVLVGSFATTFVPAGASNADLTYLGLTNYSAKTFYRNIKVWTPTQP